MKVELSAVNRFYRVSRPAAGARGLARIFRREVVDIHAVRDVSFTLGDGATLGYIGMNGAGKSTTLKMLSGVLGPSSGTVRLDGLDPVRNRRALSSRIGYLAPLKGHLWWDLPATDTFELVAQMYGLGRRAWRADAERLIAQLGFGDYLTTPVRQLSTGNRVKAELICTLLPRPDLIILDEPTLGLDLLAKEAIYDLLRSMRAESGATVVLASHDLRDVDALCDEIIIIDRSAVIWQGSIADIRMQWGGARQVTVEYSAPFTTVSAAHLTPTAKDRSSATYTFDANRFPVDALRQLLDDPRLIDMRVESLDLAKIVRQVYLTRPADQP